MTNLNLLATMGRSREKYPVDVTTLSTMNDYNIIVCVYGG